jgi:hypothetical protein
LLVAASVVPIPPILFTHRNGVLSSSEKSVLTRVTRRNIAEDGILHSHRRKKTSNLSYIVNDNFYKELCLLGCYAVWLL